MDQAEGMARGAESEELRIMDSMNDDEVNLFRFMVYRIRFSSGVAELPSSPSRFSEMGGAVRADNRERLGELAVFRLL